MLRWHSCGWLILASLAAAEAVAQEDADDQAARDRHMELVKSIAARHRIVASEDPDRALELRPDPVLSWTSPTRGNAMGGVFLWLRNGRPLAVGGVYFWLEETTKQLAREFHSLTDEPLGARYDDEPLWTPRRGSEFRAFTDARPPAANRTARLRQIKRLAARFDVTISQDDRPTEKLRLLPQPLYRYSDKDSGVIDGAVMALVHGTDPEALLLIEARSGSDGPLWHYALARCTSWEVTARLDEAVVYEAPFYNFAARDPSAAFFIAKLRPVD